MSSVVCLINHQHRKIFTAWSSQVSSVAPREGQASYQSLLTASANECVKNLQNSESGEDERFYYGLSSMQGWRISMEDAHAAILDLQVEDKKQKTSVDDRISFFGVYDGHGGDGVALFSGENVHQIIAKEEAFTDKDYEKALKNGFLASDRAILQGTNSSFFSCPKKKPMCFTN